MDLSYSDIEVLLNETKVIAKSCYAYPASGKSTEILKIVASVGR